MSHPTTTVAATTAANTAGDAGNHPFARLRPLFPILRERVQLSSCSQSALATPVAEAIGQYLHSWQSRGMDWAGWMQAVDEARAGFARLIGADAADVAVCASVSDAASAIAGALDVGPQAPDGRRGIVAGDNEFPSIGQVWLAQQRRGARVGFAQADAEGWLAPEAYARAIDALANGREGRDGRGGRDGEPGTACALVSVSHAAYRNGALQDIAAITALARERGAITFVDAYQSAGALAIDVRRDGIDLLASGAQKFLLGCPGIAFLYVRPGLAATLQPQATGWFGRVNPFAFDIRQLDWAAGAARLHTGTPPMVNAFAARAALQLLGGLDAAALEAWLRQLSAVGVQEALRLGLRLASPRAAARRAVTVALQVDDAAATERRMAEAGYLVAARGDLIRVAPHLYNTEAEVVQALRTLAGLPGTT